MYLGEERERIIKQNEILILKELWYYIFLLWEFLSNWNSQKTENVRHIEGKKFFLDVHSNGKKLSLFINIWRKKGLSKAKLLLKQGILMEKGHLHSQGMGKW